AYHFSSSAYHRDPHSFPTRRSSDLGNATVVWTSQQYDNGYRYDIYANRYTVGEGWGNASLLSSPGAYYVDTRAPGVVASSDGGRSEEHTSELQSREKLVCRLLLEKK